LTADSVRVRCPHAQRLALMGHAGRCGQSGKFPMAPPLKSFRRHPDTFLPHTPLKKERRRENQKPHDYTTHEGRGAKVSGSSALPRTFSGHARLGSCQLLGSKLEPTACR
jgi:hypothetical protein